MFGIGIIILFVTMLTQCHRLHDRMTDHDIAIVFHTTRAAVPEYEVVEIISKSLKLKNGIKIKYNAFGEKISEYLEPTDGYLAGSATPVWLSFGNKTGHVEYKKMEEGIIGKIIGMYQHPHGHSAVVAHENGPNSTSFDGHTHKLTIVSLPPHLQKLARVHKREIDPFDVRQISKKTNLHVIIKSNLFASGNDAGELLTVKAGKMLNSSKYSDDLRYKRSTRDVIYPTIMVNTDYDMSKKSANDSNYDREILYQLAFWNAVDLLFRPFNNPKIRLRIAGLIIGRNREATTYMEYGRNAKGTINAGVAIFGMIFDWSTMIENPEFPKEAYHILVTLTDTAMYDVQEDGSYIFKRGQASMSTLCSNKTSPFIAPVALVQDKKDFTGLRTAAEATGYLLGLNNDKSPGGDCDQSNGYILEPEIATKKLQWSPCSMMELSAFLRNDTINCADEPKEIYQMGEPVERILPGYIFNDHKQCQSRGFSKACAPRPEICKSLRCSHEGWKIMFDGWWCRETAPAAEGTICGHDRRCINGECTCLSRECLMESN